MKPIKRCEDCNEELNMWHPDAICKLNKEIRDLRACVYAADALAQEMNNLNEGADESVADYELAAYCEARALVTR